MKRPLAAMMATILLSACSSDCANTVISDAESPDGKYRAVMFQRDCGATTGFTTQVSVIEAGEQLSGGGNAFVADTDHGAAAAGDLGGPWAEMKWTAPSDLEVRYATGSRIFEQELEVDGIRISYRVVDDPNS